MSDDNYFGSCPVCGEPGVWLNIGATHWLVCHAHKVRWCVGMNLFSSWREETEAEWQANRERIKSYRDVGTLRGCGSGPQIPGHVRPTLRLVP